MILVIIIIIIFVVVAIIIVVVIAIARNMASSSEFESESESESESDTSRSVLPFWKLFHVDERHWPFGVLLRFEWFVCFHSGHYLRILAWLSVYLNNVVVGNAWMTRLRFRLQRILHGTTYYHNILYIYSCIRIIFSQ